MNVGTGTIAIMLWLYGCLSRLVNLVKFRKCNFFLKVRVFDVRVQRSGGVQ